MYSLTPKTLTSARDLASRCPSQWGPVKGEAGVGPQALAGLYTGATHLHVELFSSQVVNSQGTPETLRAGVARATVWGPVRYG